MKTTRVLLSSFAFSPFRGSECAVGWNIAHELVKHVEVTVLFGDVRADERARRELEKFSQNTQLPKNLSACYIAPNGLISLLERLHCLPGCWMLYYEAYRQWQQLALRKAIELHAQHPFDVVHHLTFIGYREPGYLWKLGIPFVWGPISGAENIPTPFCRSLGWREFFRPVSRNVVNSLQQVFPGRARFAARRASKVISVSRAEKEMLTRWGVDSQLMIETGTKRHPLARTRKRCDGALRIIWSGLFTPRKALPLLLHALCSLRRRGCEDWTLDVLGDGPSAGVWKELASKLEIPGENIRWLGMLARDEALQHMAGADVLVHTGLREGAPHVILEALSLGLPVICHDAGGMGTAVNSTCGFKFPLLDPACSIGSIEHALRELIQTPGLLDKLSTGALVRAGELSWEEVAKRLIAYYKEAIQK